MLDQWLNTIRSTWPDCPARVSRDGRSIEIGRAVAVYPIQGLDNLQGLDAGTVSSGRIVGQ